MNQPKPFSQNKIVFTLLSMGLVGGLIGLIIGVANGSGLVGLLIGILLTVFISIAGISANQNENNPTDNSKNIVPQNLARREIRLEFYSISAQVKPV